MLSLRAFAAADRGRMSSETDNKALLQQLRIDRTEPRPTNSAPRRRYWLIGAALAARHHLLPARLVHPRAHPALPVHTAPPAPMPGGAAASASVLDATGYVTARREATVSAQITGTLTAGADRGGRSRQGRPGARARWTTPRSGPRCRRRRRNCIPRSRCSRRIRCSWRRACATLKRAEDLVKRKLVSAAGGRAGAHPGGRAERAGRGTAQADRSRHGQRALGAGAA